MTYTVPPGRYSDVNSAFVQAYIDQSIAGVIDLAPETLNSLNELAAAINDDPAFYATIAAQVAELNTDVSDAVTALGVTENDTTFGTFTAGTLPDGVTLKAVLEAFASAYETTKSNLEAADTALSGRIDTLESDPTTATALAAVQADVDQNETDSDAAEAALSGRLDVLEADPTTATAVAAVQADVDANETASDAAESALSGRLDVLEADPTTKDYVDTQVAGLINAAPGVLNTLDELAAALNDDANFATTITNSIAAVQADVDQNETDSDAADSALSSRLDVLEADPTTATALAAVQADVDANETASDNAEAALSTRLDTLEADPTTATALTNGLALKADLAGATFTGDVIVDEGDGPTIKLETSQTGNAGIVINGSSGVYAYIDTAAGFANDSLQVYSGLFWVRAINGGDGTAMFDGDVTLQAGLNFPNGLTDAADDTAAASAGVAVGQLYRNGSVVMIRVS